MLKKEELMKNNPKLVNFTTQDFMSEKELELASLRELGPSKGFLL